MFPGFLQKTTGFPRGSPKPQVPASTLLKVLKGRTVQVTAVEERFWANYSKNPVGMLGPGLESGPDRSSFFLLEGFSFLCFRGHGVPRQLVVSGVRPADFKILAVGGH